MSILTETLTTKASANMRAWRSSISSTTYEIWRKNSPKISFLKAIKNKVENSKKHEFIKKKRICILSIQVRFLLIL